ncbi:hypothetical protein PALB_13500 [Pseudoalteromonas luteoviolacea B = ATCC 29581]|nr:hypothetical protein PALB_13500 [Pseudoalteromonas luteoviolacea B = ATCC 29581]
MNKKRYLLTVVLACAALSACKSTPQAKKEISNVNFVYTPVSNAPKTDKTIAIVSPVYESSAGQLSSSADKNLTALYANQLGQSNSVQVNFNHSMNQYTRRLVAAMSDSFNEIVIKKGFKIAGPYTTFDDITYTDKKSAYLALVPNLEIFIDQKRTSNECGRSYCEDVGSIKVSGTLNVKLIEPMTGQTFLSKRINLADLTESKVYTKRWHYQQQSNSLVGLALNAAIDATADESKDKPLIDDTDKVLVDALNEFYAKAMSKVDSYLSHEEILSFSGDVEKVKGLKRF